MLALQLLRIAPDRLNGLWVRARSGPVRDRFLERIHALWRDNGVIRIHPNVDDEALYGGLDWTAALTGRGVRQRAGLLERRALLLLSMADRCTSALSVRLAQALDRPETSVIALDEGEDGLAPAIVDRLAFFIDLEGIAYGDCVEPTGIEGHGDDGALRPSDVDSSREAIDSMTRLAASLGIGSLRAPLLALHAAKAHAANFGRISLDFRDIQTAAELVYPHRATALPTEPEDSNQDPPQPQSNGQNAPEDTGDRAGSGADEILLDAVKAALPREVLERLAAGEASRRAVGSSGSGAARRGNRRGRPLPSRPGRLNVGARLDLVATLRAAAPWQKIRKSASPRGQKVHILPSDIRLKQFEQRSDRLLVFAVDASGSAAMARLAEAKGAVELLLAEAYARRDHVALIAFREKAAELLLPPTRSLVQTKRRLATLPGGGATPLAAGMFAASELADHAKKRGYTPTLAILTDGRGNIALDGTSNRAVAQNDSEAIARLIRHQRTSSIVIDTATRPQRPLKDLARLMGAEYLPLPRADSHRLAQRLTGCLE